MKLFGLKIWVIFCRVGPRGTKRLILCPWPSQAMARPGSEAALFIPLGCSQPDSENVITKDQTSVASQIPPEGGGGGPACFLLCVGGANPHTRTDPRLEHACRLLASGGPCTPLHQGGNPEKRGGLCP